jgi:hypothetical protein
MGFEVLSGQSASVQSLALATDAHVKRLTDSAYSLLLIKGPVWILCMGIPGSTRACNGHIPDEMWVPKRCNTME